MFGEIMSISRLRMGTDGKGISTLVGFYDCPLHCQYCINNQCHETDSSFYDTERALYTPDELIKVLNKDEIYYLMTDGGVVFGGGEPLLQSAFIHEVCEIMDPRWNRRIETSLNVPWRNILPVIDDIDEWIIDIKDMDDDIYKSYTGVDNHYLRENLIRFGNRVNSNKLRVRVPRIPDYNTNADIEKSTKWIKDVLNVEPEVFDYYK